jgi:hypothetical protein
VQEIKLVLTPRDTKAQAGPDGKFSSPLIQGPSVEGEG